MLKLESVCYSYKQAFRLDDVSFKVNKGECLGIIGKSGCGKTTILKLIFGEFEPESGKIEWDGKKVLGPSEQLISGHEDFKYVTQDFELMPFISVLENIIKPLSRQYMSQNVERARTLLKVVDLERFEHRKVKNLSGGQKQRVALAQALAKKPKLLLLDEPFSHIDNFLKNELRRNLFELLKKEEITCVVVTHDIADILPFSDNIAVLKNGNLLKYNSPENLYNSPELPYVAGLFGDYNHIESDLITDLNVGMESVIVYPQDVEIEEDRHGNTKVIDQYFSGSHYLVKVKWNNKNIYLNSQEKLDPENTYNLIFNLEKIKVRNRS
jgi:ABC-type Fe3+/spermidine/putrescine transport system ATPase subunit